MWGMVRIKVLRLNNLFYYLVIALLIGSIIFLGYQLISRIRAGGSIFSPKEDSNTQKKDVYLKVFKINDPRAIVDYQMPFLSGISRKEETVETGASRGQSMERDIDGPEVFLKHDPEMPEEIKIQISKIEDDLGPIVLTGQGPQIMIYHTHSREAYKPDPSDPYEVAEAFRCNDLNHTVVRVGDVLTRHLETKGISVLHDRAEHEQGNHSTSYERSLKTLQKRMKEYKSLKVFIDIHRNAYKEGSAKKPDDEVVIIDGKRVAKVFVVIGTGEGYLGGFKDKPNWKENYKFAMRLTNKLNELHSGLAKPIYVKPSRFNQHVSTKAILIEVGSNLTTLEEAERSTKYLAEAISQIAE
jgi:stage II sporulation protein P